MQIISFLTFIIFTFLLEKVINVTCPADRPYLFNSLCFPECPWDPPDVTYLYDVDNSCRPGNYCF